jgi:hypothetical protein
LLSKEIKNFPSNNNRYRSNCLLKISDVFVEEKCNKLRQMLLEEKKGILEFIDNLYF